MAQSHQRYCPNCGTPVSANERFCTNCGAQMNPEQPFPQIPTQYPQAPQVPQSQQQVQQAQRPGQYYQAPPASQQVPPTYAQQPQSKQNPIVEAFAALGLLFLFRRSVRRGYTGRYQRRSSGCCGAITLLVILAIFAAIGYGVYRSVGSSIHNLNSVYSSGSGSSSTGSGNGELTSQPAITTANINQTVTYAGVDISIISVQQSTAFIDDTSSARNGMIRVKIKETNNSGQNASYFYSDMAHLVLPDKSSVAPTNEMQPGAPQNGTTRDNWLDFAVPTSDKINQMTLVLGTTQQAQISIPLTGNANLSAFQAKTVNPNIPISYAGLNWTLKTATSTLSASGKQATSGMRYVVLTFNVDNPTSQSVNIGFVSDYMRLKSGGIMNGPADGINTTLPLQINPNTTGVSGTVTFLMPGNDTAFTLIFLAIPNGIDPHSNVQVNTDFTI